MSSSLPAPPQEQQPVQPYRIRAPRKRTFLKGKLIYGGGTAAENGSFTADCTVHNISEGGAKITLEKQEMLSPELYLIVTKYSIAYKARIAWLDFPARGLQFYETYPLDAALPDGLKFLRKLWGDLYARSGADMLPA